MEPEGPSSANSTSQTQETSSDLATSESQKKRNRIRFSCTTCRDKKLKCNRRSPCDQCEKRGIVATCEYVPYVTPRAQGGRASAPFSPSAGNSSASGIAARSNKTLNDAPLQSRLRHLEHLVQVLKAQRKDSTSFPAEASKDGSGRPVEADTANADGLVDDNAGAQCVRVTTTAGSIVDDLRYLDSANWEAILDELSTLTNDLRTVDDDFEDPVELAAVKKSGPVLLLGTFPQASMSEMVTYLPPRVVTDRLIARFFQGKEPAWMMFHVPAFLRQYEKFWDSPSEASYTFLGLLFLMISHAALFCLRGDEEVPGKLGTPEQVFDVYRARGAQCLVLDDYTKPGKFKVETLLLYFGTEYLRNTDTVLGTSIILTMAIRLAMHMGYHRDPKHYPQMSPWEGEMRRRLWAILREVDVLVSFQFGMPSNIHTPYYDTQTPRNLHDEDFDEDAKELPPARPETDRTCALYSIVKSRLINSLSDISSALSSRLPVSYQEIMHLDKQLETAHSSFASILRYKPFSQSVTDPVDLIMQRYWLELLYQKSRTVLHRKYLGIARFNELYAHSRSTCLDAATKTLRHQYDIHCEMQPGGRLSKERWFMNSISTHDFLLADMILCLELSYLNAQAKSPAATAHALEALEHNTTPAIIPREQLLDILRTSRSIWQTSRKESTEANRAFKILSRMLSMSAGSAYPSSPESIESAFDRDLDLRQPPNFQVGGQRPLQAGQSQPQPQGTQVSPQDPVQSTGLNVNPSQCFEARLTSASPWPSSSSGAGQQQEGNFQSGWPENLSGLAGIDTETGGSELIDPNLGSDWSLWDTQIQNASEDMLQIPWNTFFQPGGGGF